MGYNTINEIVQAAAKNSPPRRSIHALRKIGITDKELALIPGTEQHKEKRAQRGFGTIVDDPSPLRKIPVYDEGGEVDVNDGKHQLAIIEDGERVLTPEQNAAYKSAQDLPVESRKQPGMPTIMPKVGPLGTAFPQSPDTQHPLGDEVKQPSSMPHSTDTSASAPPFDPLQLINDDKVSAAKNGDLVGFGKALINEKHFSPTMPMYSGPGEAPATGELIPTKEMHGDKSKYYDQQIQDALDKAATTNDPAYQEQADRLKLAKAQYEKNTPWGSEGNHPGILGKIAHVAAGVGNIAGDIVAPSTMELIPGTDLNKQVQASKLGRALSLDTEDILKASEAKDKDAETQAKQNVNKYLHTYVGADGYQHDVFQTASGIQDKVAGPALKENDPKKGAYDYLLHGGPNGEPLKDAEGKPYNEATAYQRVQTYGQKPEKTDDKETYVQQYLKQLGLQDIPANRDKALKAYATANQAPERPQQTLMTVPDGKGGLKVIEARPGMTISPEAGKPGAGAAHFNDPVVTYDPKTKQNIVTERGQVPPGQFAYKADPERISTTIAGMNDVQNKINDLGNVVYSTDMKDIQQGLVADAISEINHDFEVGIFGTHIPLDRINGLLDAENMGSANQATRNFIVAYIGAREAITQLPRLQTFGKSNRMTEAQMRAAIKLLPGAESDAALAQQKMDKLQGIIDPLRKQIPLMPGNELMHTFLEERQGSRKLPPGW
jgi:hypothetical protein